MNINIEDDIVSRLAAAIRPLLEGSEGLSDNRVVRRYTRQLLRGILTTHEAAVAVAVFDDQRETARRQAIEAAQVALTGEG